VFVGAPRAQARPELFRWPQLIAVTDLESAHAAIEEIIDQGEGARGNWHEAHYGRFLDMWTEFGELKAADPSFEPGRAVQAAFVEQPYDVVAPQTLVTDPAARAVAELFNLAYEALLQVLTRFFTHTDETDPQLEALVGSAFDLMTGVLRPLGSSLTEMPVGEQHPGRTTGPCFERFYPMGNFVPWRDSAWVVLTERVSVLADLVTSSRRKSTRRARWRMSQRPPAPSPAASPLMCHASCWPTTPIIKARDHDSATLHQARTLDGPSRMRTTPQHSLGSAKREAVWISNPTAFALLSREGSMVASIPSFIPSTGAS
jgi:hypothetical protein